LNSNGHKVTLWEFNKEYCEILKTKRENVTLLPGITIPAEINITNDLAEACSNKKLIVIAIPTQFIRSAIKNLDFNLIKDSILVSVSKGIEVDTDLTVSQIIRNVYPAMSPLQLGVLSGPSHAEEVSRLIPTTVVAASTDISTARLIQHAFMNSYCGRCGNYRRSEIWR
jgi:glycerol-3-phosphate dehydrogenase (NAD(P)+)